MRRIIESTLLVAAFALLPSCTKNYYESGLDIDAQYYKVSKSSFTWNEDYGRWQYSTGDDWLTKYQVEEMEVAGTVIFGNDFCPMPYVDSYYVDFADGTWAQVVQNTGFEVTYGRVTFYIQTNEKELTRERMLDEYEFKVSLFYWH